ncbi:MAG TPA: DUF4129 domain-containing protein [Puia sp.]|jgi:hypothetical protein
MFKYFFRIIFVFLVCVPAVVCAQATTDTIGSIRDTPIVQSDSSASVVPDTSYATPQNGPAEINEDSLYTPVRDSLYLNAFLLREVPLTKVNKYLSDRDYDYANNPEYWSKEKKGNDPDSSPLLNFLGNKVVQWVFLISVIVVIIYGIYLLARENNFKWFIRRQAQADQGESDSAGHGPVDYDESIRKYQTEGNYRMAVRYLYLRLLYLATEKNIIPISASMTNAEIGRAFGQHPLASQFRYLATAYEYIFFGDFNVNREIFDVLKTKFEAFQQKLGA